MGLFALLRFASSCLVKYGINKFDTFSKEEVEDGLSICLEDRLDEKPENSIALVSLLIADHEPSQATIKEVLRVAWNCMGAVKVVKAKANVYSIIVGDEKVARRLVDGNPWFVKGHTFTTMLWPLYPSLDDIAADMAVYWVQAHGLPRNLCTSKNARVLGARVGAVMEVEDIDTAGFRGFIRIRVNLDASKPLSPGFTMPCPVKGKRLIRLRYEGLRDFCYSCGKLGHSRGCQITHDPRLIAENLQHRDWLRAAPVSRVSVSLFQENQRKRDWNLEPNSPGTDGRNSPPARKTASPAIIGLSIVGQS